MNDSENLQITEFNHQNVVNLIYNLETLKKNLEDILKIKTDIKEISDLIDNIEKFLTWINQFKDKNHEKTVKDYTKREEFIKKLKGELEKYFKSNQEIIKWIKITKSIKNSKSILELLDGNIEFNPSENDENDISINYGITEDSPFFMYWEKLLEEKEELETKISYLKDDCKDDRSSENPNKINISSNNNNKNSLTERKEKFLNNFYKAINILISKFDILASSNDNDIDFPDLKDVSLVKCVLEFFEWIWNLSSTIENHYSENTESINSQLKNFIESYKIYLSTNSKYSDEVYEAGEDNPDNFKFIDVKKTLFYFINIISKENRKYNKDDLKKISENISCCLEIKNSDLMLIQNSSIDNFVKSFNFQEISLAQNEMFPPISKLYELKSIKYNLLINDLKINENKFDNRGNFLNPNLRKNKFRGKELYYPPYNWMGIGLNILGRFDDGNDNWIEDISKESEWAIAYRGISSKNPNVVKKILKNFIENRDLKSAIVNFKKKLNDRRHWKTIDSGIYVTPYIKVAEKYTQTISFNNKNYKVLLMAKVKIREIMEPKGSLFWILNNNNIRIYRVIFKESK